MIFAFNLNAAMKRMDMNNLTGAPEKLPEFPKELRRGGTGLQPTSWSSDGRYLVGGSGFSSASGPPFIYDTQTKTFKRLGPTGLNPQFLPDDRRVVMTLLSGRLAVIDIETGDTRDVLSLRGELVRSATPSPDGRFLYFLRFIQAGDIWTVGFDAPDGQLARTP